MDNFDPFDIESSHEEVVWLVTMASFFMPEIFDIKNFATSFLTYTHGPKLIAHVSNIFL